MDFEVNRRDFRDTRVTETPPPELRPGQVRLAVERFAFTMNNISYAGAGDLLDYWGFFPTEEGWGRLPAMGLSSIVESAHPDLQIGGRYFGFTSMSDEVVIDARPTTTGFVDAGPHRAEHAPVYTSFVDVETDDLFDPDRPDEYLLFKGLFLTSFLVDDFLADAERGPDAQPFNGARQTIVTSASSKTSIALAACLAQRDDHVSIGLTSQRNRGFVERLGLYDNVLAYDEVDHLDGSVPTGVVDMAGNADLRAQIHNLYGDDLRFSLTVGATHWDAPRRAPAALPGPEPEFFFAPAQSVKRAKEWGADVLAARIAASFQSLLDGAQEWLTVEHHRGPEGVTEVHDTLVGGGPDPAIGHIVSLQIGALS